VHDGELVEIVEIHAGRTGMDVVLKCTSKQALIRASFNELLTSGATRVIPERDGPSGDDDFEPAGVVLAQLSGAERNEVIDRAAHVREVLTGFRSGSNELALRGQPRSEYRGDVPLSVWDGIASNQPPPIEALGYTDKSDFATDVARLRDQLGRDHPDLLPVDWSRIRFLAEISWASDMFGAGVEFELVSPFADSESLALLRSIQRALIRIVNPTLVFPRADTDNR
jgi:hypothetical protein